MYLGISNFKFIFNESLKKKKNYIPNKYNYVIFFYNLNLCTQYLKSVIYFKIIK